MKVSLRPQLPEDGKVSWLYKRYVNMWTYAVCESPIPVTETTEVEFYRKCLSDPTCIRRAIIVDGVYVGNIFVDGIKDDTAELHTHIFNCGYWQKGVGTKAQMQFLEELFKDTWIKNVRQVVSCDNKPNVVIARKLGFETIGEVVVNGISCYQFELKKERWQKNTNMTI